MNPLIWFALLFFVTAFIVKKSKYEVAAFGWVIFAAYWLFQAGIFLNMIAPSERAVDASDVALSLLVVLFCLIMARFMFISQKESLFLLTKATTLTCLFYFPFAEIPFLNYYIISFTAWVVTSLVNFMGLPVVQVATKIYIGTKDIEIILACTAIESMALFAGVIAGINADLRRKLVAFFATVPTIYLLNLIRNIYVVFAYAQNWYGTPEQSFYLAHHVISKAGSAIALIVLAYVLFRILPEVLDMIENASYALMGREPPKKEGGSQ
jgi:archaeosortase A (PGF-CTERM-specific)